MSLKAKKLAYRERVASLFEEYPRVLLVNSDHIGSNHLHSIRHAVRGDVEILMGKNTLMRKVIRMAGEDSPDILAILPHIAGNVGLAFTRADPVWARAQLTAMSVNVGAKVGSMAPTDLYVPRGSTGLEPTKTSFFQTLNIPTKIEKGQIEITADVRVTAAGEKVGASECTLFNMLNIKPFVYRLRITSVYDSGQVYDSGVLDISKDQILQNFKNAVDHVAAISLAIHRPTVASVPHTLANGFQDLLAVALASQVRFKQAESIVYRFEHPKEAAAAAASAQACPAAAAAGEQSADQKQDSEEEEDDDGAYLATGLFGDD